ncbi:MAG: 5'-3' exonuclease H3TH domain-containing protein, partial [Candidatus Pacebacteria bacterium]|nr:5'-3' exonuclease H3TH domain-containing protein [Candidatus Paceibacterota bacterium]
KAAGVSVFEKKGYEADDVIGTIANMAPSSVEVIIMTGDLDALQLVNKNIKVFSLKKGIKEGVFYDEEKVKERYLGLSPGQLLEYKALRGDPSDNIPGIFGIGEKTAIEIIKKFSNLENLYDNFEKEGILKEGLIEKIKKGKDIAFISRGLSEIKKDVPLSFDIEKCLYQKEEKKVVAFLKKYGFNSLILRFLEKEKKNMTLF